MVLKINQNLRNFYFFDDLVRNNAYSSFSSGYGTFLRVKITEGSIINSIIVKRSSGRYGGKENLQKYLNKLKNEPILGLYNLLTIKSKNFYINRFNKSVDERLKNLRINLNRENLKVVVSHSAIRDTGRNEGEDDDDRIFEAIYNVRVMGK